MASCGGEYAYGLPSLPSTTPLGNVLGVSRSCWPSAAGVVAAAAGFIGAPVLFSTTQAN